MLYVVTKQYRGGSQINGGSFKTLEEARAFVQAQINEAITMKIKNMVIRILEGVDDLEIYDVDKLDLAESSGQGQNSAVTFKPTPFNAAPRPGGVPHSWVKDKEDGDKKK